MDSNIKIFPTSPRITHIDQDNTINSDLSVQEANSKLLSKLPKDLGIFLRPGSASTSQWAHFIKSKNSLFQLKIDSDIHCLENLLDAYIKESSKYGLNSDILIAQMCLRTEYLSYPEAHEGLTADQNNFAGLGSLDPTTRGATFATAHIGIRAHVQHLFGYASTDELKDDCEDPRFCWINKLNYRGSISDIFSFQGR